MSDAAPPRTRSLLIADDLRLPTDPLEHPAGGASTPSDERSNAQELPAAEAATPAAAITPNAPGGIIPYTLSLIERIALDPSIDVSRLERLLTFQERLIEKQAEREFNDAKGRILAKLAGVKIVKNRWVQYPVEKNNPRAGSYDAFKYAPLEDIDKVMRPLLAEEQMDLSFSDEPQADGRVMIRGRLKHLPGGHFEDSFMAAPMDTSGGKNNVQAVGSSNSYLRRYVTCNIFNIVVVGDDDDGSGGPMSQEQASEILELIRTAKVGQKFLRFMHWPSAEDGRTLEAIVAAASRRDYAKAKSTLVEQIARARGNADPA